jgi:hypothetical protein
MASETSSLEGSLGKTDIGEHDLTGGWFDQTDLGRSKGHRSCSFDVNAGVVCSSRIKSVLPHNHLTKNVMMNKNRIRRP